ncbi:Hypothetical protein EAG7_00953 [Klebsiella aerogenes]|nr:Hypothetical protein EAG7_00953 [Klebsiella aerogenes]PVF76217.1 hypothetical protein CSC18_2301 [Klebsiella aerogenes]CCG29459.1 hypothetical protein [Klebsiella aerogenes EA1509E]
MQAIVRHDVIPRHYFIFILRMSRDKLNGSPDYIYALFNVD